MGGYEVSNRLRDVIVGTCPRDCNHRNRKAYLIFLRSVEARFLPLLLLNVFRNRTVKRAVALRLEENVLPESGALLRYALWPRSLFRAACQ